MLILLPFWYIICNVDACTHGDIRIAGVSSDSILAGRVDLCYQSEWRVVCQNRWGRNDAMVVCRQFGFPAEGAQFCISSCLGRNNTIHGVNNFECSGNEEKLVDCPPPNLLDGICGQTIGVICSSTTFDVFEPSSFVTTTSAASVSPTTTTLCQSTAIMQDQQGNENTTVIGINTGVDGNKTTSTAWAALGGVVGVLMIILVGVVIGWSWTCRNNNKRKSSRTLVNALTSTAYASSTSSSIPLHSMDYSSPGPRNVPLNDSLSKNIMSAPESDERIYEVPAEEDYEVLKESSDAEEDVYHELGDTREGKRSEILGEVPKGEDISNGDQYLSVYSTLQHN